MWSRCRSGGGRFLRTRHTDTTDKHGANQRQCRGYSYSDKQGKVRATAGTTEG